MILFLLRLIATLLHAALMFALAPLLHGAINKLRARLLGRRGAPVLQPYLTLLKLSRKTIFTPDTATDFFKIWPYAAFAATGAVALLVPGFCTGLLTVGSSDYLTVIGLLTVARAATMLAALETGFGFGGAAAARDALFGTFAEAAFIVVILTVVLIGHDATIDGTARIFRSGDIGIQVSLGFALAGMLGVALTEAGRMPTDNPAGHLELAMVHEAMILEYSGGLLALFEYAAMLRLLVWMSLIGTIFCPFLIATAGDILSWPGGILTWTVKLGVLGIALAVFEVSTAKMRIFRIPEFLGAAILLGALSAIFLFLAGKIGG